MAVTIRPIQPRDFDAVVTLWNRALPRDTTTAGRFLQWLVVNPDFNPATAEGAMVAEESGRVIGFARAIVRTWPNDTLGVEEDNGWIPVMFVAPERQRQGVGTKLLDACLALFRERSRRRVWLCGNTGSAPGYLFPGVDRDAYAGAFSFFQRRGFAVDHEPVAMSGSTLDYDFDRHRAEAWTPESSTGVEVRSLTPEMVMPFLAFLREAFPGDWNAVARAKLRTGRFDEVLLATLDGAVVGYCQWEGEHFGPFGVREDVRGKKLGAKLFCEAVRRIKAADGRTVWFNWADEGPARFYERHGLKVTRRFAIMRRELAP